MFYAVIFSSFFDHEKIILLFYQMFFFCSFYHLFYYMIRYLSTTRNRGAKTDCFYMRDLNQKMPFFTPSVFISKISHHHFFGSFPGFVHKRISDVSLSFFFFLSLIFHSCILDMNNRSINTNNNMGQRVKVPNTNYAQAAATKTQTQQARGHQPQQPNTDLEPPYLKPPYKPGPYHNRNTHS